MTRWKPGKQQRKAEKIPETNQGSRDANTNESNQGYVMFEDLSVADKEMFAQMYGKAAMDFVEMVGQLEGKPKEPVEQQKLKDEKQLKNDTSKG